MKNEPIITFEMLKNYRAISIEISRTQCGFWRMIWGTDIFVNGIPVLKVFLLINILMWIF
jgi:hypothetical protein